MSSTPTTEYGLEQQGLGDNPNTWGDDHLNQVIRAVAQIIGKVLAIAITGDYTITSTNYVTSADNKNAGWRFTGTLTANATITVPSSNAIFHVENATTGGFSVIIKTFAGTGITVPNGRTALLRCNASDVSSLFPTHMGTTFTPSLPGDAANVSFVETAIANATIPAAAGTVLVTGADTTAGYLGAKTTGSKAVTASTTSPGGNEVRDFSVEYGALADQGIVTGTFVPTANGKVTINTIAALAQANLDAAATAGTLCLMTKEGDQFDLFLNGTVNGDAGGFTVVGTGTFTLKRGQSNGWIV